MDVRGEQGGGAQVIGGGCDRLVDRESGGRQKHSVGLDDGAASVGPAGGTRTQKGTPPHGGGSVHANSGFEGSAGALAV